MPYIEFDKRMSFDVEIQALANGLMQDGYVDAGELNYAITRLIQLVTPSALRYSHIATVSGVLQNVYSEWYRRVVVPYEDEKRRRNGDVYES